MANTVGEVRGLALTRGLMGQQKSSVPSGTELWERISDSFCKHGRVR